MTVNTINLYHISMYKFLAGTFSQFSSHIQFLICLFTHRYIYMKQPITIKLILCHKCIYHHKKICVRPTPLFNNEIGLFVRYLW